MFSKRLGLFAAGALLSSGMLTVPAALPAAAATSAPVLTTIRAAHHTGYDRFVMEFSGPVPAFSYRWVQHVVADASGLSVRVAGHRFLQLRLEAQAHTTEGVRTVATRATYSLPNLTQSVITGDFEGVLTMTLGMQQATPMNVMIYHAPSRVVVDITTPYRWINRNVYYQDVTRYATGRMPYTIGVVRPVIPPSTGRQALERLFAGPTPAERGAGLRFVASGATGFTHLTINDGIARLWLTGTCASRGATYTIADQIMPTLKQFSTVTWVKIYDATGHTESPTGDRDSIPTCLEP